MKTSDLVRMCVQNLRRRKFRTFLTVIGVVIGTCAIISMASLGIGINKTNDELIAGWGDLSIIDIYGATTAEAKMNDETLSEIGRIPDVDAVTPFVSAMEFNLPYDGSLTTGKKDRYAIDGLWSLTGVYPDALEKLGYKIGEGRMLERGSNGKYIEIVIGQDVPYTFTDTKRKPPHNQITPFPDINGVVKPPFVDPTKDVITLKLPYGTETGNKQSYLTYEVRVVGVLDGGDGNNYEMRSNIYMDANDLQKISKEYKKVSKSKEREQPEYGQVRVKVGKLEHVSEVEEEIKNMGFFTNSMESYRQEAMKKTQQMQLILGGLGAISLLVASISIANTMVMSVYERTKEIGIMKVLGCFVQDIRKIFLVEAALIGFFGGILGVILSYIISYILNMFGGSLGESLGLIGGVTDGAKLSVIPPWLVVVGMIFATVIGIIAGVYPAYRAVKISALEAIKQD